MRTWIMFDEEKPALQPLPLEPFRYYQYGERTVHLDGCVEVEAAYYSAPPGWISRRVAVQWDGQHVRLLHPKTVAARAYPPIARPASKTRTGPNELHSVPCNCWRPPKGPDRTRHAMPCAASRTRGSGHSPHSGPVVVRKKVCGCTSRRCLRRRSGNRSL
jgi:hypothetical protein